MAGNIQANFLFPEPRICAKLVLGRIGIYVSLFLHCTMILKFLARGISLHLGEFWMQKKSFEALQLMQ